MILHKNGRFYIGNRSFSLPDNIYLDCSAEEAHEALFAFYSEDERYQAQIYASDEELSGTEFFEDLMQKSDSLQKTSEVVEFDEGIRGCYLFYENSKTEYCEIHFDMEHEEYNTLSVWIYAKKKDADIHTIMKEQTIQDFLYSIQ